MDVEENENAFPGQELISLYEERSIISINKFLIIRLTHMKKYYFCTENHVHQFYIIFDKKANVHIL